MYKEDLALNNLQWFICHKTQLNKTYVGYLMQKTSLWKNSSETI